MTRNHHHATIALLLLSATALPALAGPIDVAQAQQNVEQFRQAFTRNGMHKAAGAATPLEHVYTYTTPDGHPALFVFNTGDEGYIIASADDDAMTILGYSTEGTFNPENVPDGMRYMFGLFAEEIASLDAMPASARKAPRKAESTVGRIEPLLGPIEWDQMPPYNLKCPITMGGTSNGQSNGSRSATGCMTTALAQIMFYHRHPEHGYGSIEFDVKEGVKTVTWTTNPYEHYYHWDSMGNNKNDFAKSGTGYNTTNPGVDGVSQLMLDLGMALRTSYGTASSASSSRIIPALTNYFDYDATSLKLVRRMVVGEADFERQVLEELQAERPVYFDGTPNASTGGHAFVCDGYDGNGFFHINWGWSGLSNNFFSLTALDPSSQGTGSTGAGYNYDLTMVRGIKPRPADQERILPYPTIYDKTAVANRPGTTNSPGIWVATADDSRNDDHRYEFVIDEQNDFWFAAEFGTPPLTNIDVRARLGILVVKPDGSRELLWDKSGNPTMLFNNFPYYNFKVNMKESWKQAGTRIYYIYNAYGEDETALVRNKEKQVCSFRLVQKDGQLVAEIDRTEPSAPLDYTSTPVVQQPPYFTNTLAFDYNLDSPRPNRRIGTIGMQVQETGKSVAYQVDNSKMYRNMTEDAVFKVPAGTTVKPSVTMAAGDWMHGYFYIDYNHDLNLTSNPNDLSQAGTDLVAYSYWTGDRTNGNAGYNSANQAVSNSNTLDMPAFKAPATPGTYYVRFKIDWNCVDPGGNTGYMQNGALSNTIVQNGGAIVDAKLIVTDPLPEPEPEDPELVVARNAYLLAQADYYAFKEQYWVEPNPQAFLVAEKVIQELDYYIGWVADDTTIRQYNNATNIINTKLAEARRKINEILGLEEPDDTAERELAAARETYATALAAYNAFKTEYSTHENDDVRDVVAALASKLATSLYLAENATKEQYTTAAQTIDTEVVAARSAIEEILNRVVPDPVDPALTNAKLSGIYISYGTSTSTMLQLAPAFHPDTHIYLARHLDTDIDNTGTCWISPYYTYSIWGTAQDSKATVSGPVQMQPRPDWNHVTLTCTAADKKTTETYHIILLSNSGGDSTPNTYDISDLTIMLHLLGPDFGYTDEYFDRFISKDKVENLVNKILQKN